MYPSQGLAPNQPGFAGAPNSQQVYQNYQQQQNYQQSYGYPQQHVAGYPNVVTQPGYGQTAPALPYPQWFGQVTGVDPISADNLIRNMIPAILNQYAAALNMAFPLGFLLQPGGDQHPFYTNILTSARYSFILLMLSNTHYDLPTRIQLAVTTAVIGQMVDAVGGVTAAQLPAIEQVLQIDLRKTHQNYTLAPQKANEVIHATQMRIFSQNAMNGTGVPNTMMGNGQINNGYASQRVAASALTSMGTMTSGFLNPAIQRQPTPFDGVGEVSGTSNDVYSMSLSGAVGRLTTSKEEQQNAQTAAPLNQKQQQTNDPGNCIMNAFALQTFALTGSNAAEEPSHVEETVTTPTTGGITLADDNCDVGEITRSVLPRTGVTPTAVNAVPTHGLPSKGHYDFGKDGYDVNDYGTPATLEQHLNNAPAPGSTFSGELSDNEEFLNQSQYEQDAMEQVLAESISPTPGYASMDDMLDVARQQGYEVREPRMVVPYSNLSAEERTGLVRRLRIRIVPAYFRTKTGLIQIAEGARREIVIEKWDETVDYTKHETEIELSKSFASWDRQALDISAARNIMATSAKQDAWSEEFFTRKLKERIEEDPTEDVDNILTDLIADRQIIDIDEPVITKATTNDHQSEIITELSQRGVDGAGTFLENSIVRYTRFETNNFILNDENRLLIDNIRLVTTAAEVVPAIENFKINSTIPIREIARLISRFTQQVNRYLATEFANGWSVTNAVGDFKDLYEALVEAYDPTIGENQVIATLNAIYVSAAKYAFRLMDLTTTDVSEIAVGTLSCVVLVPFYYSQYPIDFLDSAGAVLKENHPELYEFLNVASENCDGDEVNIVTLDNVMLTFTRSLGEDRLFFMVAKS